MATEKKPARKTRARKVQPAPKKPDHEGVEGAAKAHPSDASNAVAGDAGTIAGSAEPVTESGGVPLASAEELDAISLENIGGESLPPDESRGGRGEGGGLDAADPAFLGSQVFARFCHTGSAILAARRGAHWVLTEAEADALGADIDACLALILPRIPEQYGPVVSLGMNATMILAPRLMADAAIAAKAAEKEPESKGPDASSTG